MALASLGRDPPPFFRQGPSALSRLALFSALALLLMVADARFQMMQPLRATIATAMYPLQWLAFQPLHLSQILRARSDAWMANEDAMRVLGEQLFAERQRSQQSGQLSLENQRLRSLLDLRARIAPDALAAQVLYDAADPYTRKVVLDKGQNQGVQLASPVLDERGVLGQVTRVFPLSSEVTLITDRDHAIPVVNVRTGARGVAYGDTVSHADAMELRFMAANADVAVGDVLTTSGVDGVYPAGLPVARIDKVERRTEAVFARIECVPLALVSGASHVLVLSPQFAPVARPEPEPEPERKPLRTGGRR
jgi:rod shape-determining protein MreC